MQFIPFAVIFYAASKFMANFLQLPTPQRKENSFFCCLVLGLLSIFTERIGGNLLVIALKSSQILSGL